MPWHLNKACSSKPRIGGHGPLMTGEALDPDEDGCRSIETGQYECYARVRMVRHNLDAIQSGYFMHHNGPGFEFDGIDRRKSRHVRELDVGEQ